MNKKRPKSLAVWKNEVRRKIQTARLRTIDAFPLNFQKELSETNKVIKRAGRSKFGQSSQGMVFLNNLINKLNTMSTKNYSMVSILPKAPAVAITAKEAERIQAQRKFYRESAKTKARAKILADLGLGITAGKLAQIADRYGAQAIKAILERLRQYEVNARTGRKRITQEAYEEMTKELQKLLVNQLANPDPEARMRAIASLIAQRMRYFYEKDSDIQGHLWGEFKDDWQMMDWGNLAEEMAMSSVKFSVKADLNALAQKYHVPLEKVFDYLNRMKGRIEYRAQWIRK